MPATTAWSAMPRIPRSFEASAPATNSPQAAACSSSSTSAAIASNPPEGGSAGHQLGDWDRVAIAAQLDGDSRRSGAGATDRLAAQDELTRAHAEAAEIGQHRHPAAAMIDDDDAAVAAERRGVDDSTGRRGDHRRLGWRFEGEAAGMDAPIRNLADPGEKPSLDRE